MPIVKTITKANGVTLSFHRIRRVSFSETFVRIDVGSWANQAAHDDGLTAVETTPVVDVALEAGSPAGLFAAAEAALVASAGAFQGGTIVTSTALEGLALAKVRRWSELKLQRDQVEEGGFSWDGAAFDSDPASQMKIQGSAQLATLAMLAGMPYAVDWTLANNSVRSLSGADMLAVGQALGAHILATHVTGRAVRAAVEAAETVEQVLAVAWPP